MTTEHDDLAAYINALPFVDTHSHMAGFDVGSPADDRGGRSLPQLLMKDYLQYLAGSCGQLPEPPAGKAEWGVEDAEAHFRAILPLLDQYRALTTYAVLREGLRELYGFDEPDITESNWRRINDQIVRAYRTHGERAWQRQVVRRAGVVLKNQMVVLPYVTDHWDALPPDERAAQKRFLLPSLILDGYLFTGFSTGKPGRERSTELVGLHPTTHGEYVEFCRRVLDLFVAKGGRSVKLLTAYHRTLRFEQVGDDEAAPLFARGPEALRGDDFRRLQDNLCWHLLELAHARGLPLIVHAGYSSPSEWADAEHLIPLLTSPRLAGMKIDICHSNWPREGGALIMARTYRGAYFNLCWTPMLSRALGKRVLSEAIDMTPMNKLLLGTDCGSAESFLGTVRLLRSVLAEVLTEKVRAKQFGADVARGVAKAILFDNALEFYGMTAEQVPTTQGETP